MSCPFAPPTSGGPDSPFADTDSNPSHKQLGGKLAGVPTKLKPGADPISYHEYLNIDKLLSCQELRSAKYGAPAHDEMLFITTHQVYELWFKQILHELTSVITLFGEETSNADEGTMLKMTERLGRVVQILKMCVGQFNVLLTMTPMDFASFRDFLVPASGFQSLQFRIMENTIGLKTINRIKYNRADYKSALDHHHQKAAEDSENGESLLNCVETWLERNPALKTSWWEQLTANLNEYLAGQRAEAETCEDPAMREELLHGCKLNEDSYLQLIDPAVHNAMLAKGQRKISHKALQSAYMIFLFRDKARFQVPFKLMVSLMDIDNELIEWRHKHAGMVQRMIGTKMGTGGSSGYMYLRATISDRYKVFLDISTLSTFLMPPHLIPPLSEGVETKLAHSSSKGSPDKPLRKNPEGAGGDGL